MENKDDYKEQLALGIEVEKDHYNDKSEMCNAEDADALATVIAKRHLKDDKNYYKKLKNAGLDEGTMTPLEAGYVEECGDMGGIGAVMPVGPNVAVIKIDVPTDDTQAKLSSSGLGSGGSPKPLKSDKLEAPAEKAQVGPNKVVVTKTPPITGTADPLDHFGGQMLEKW
jgi:hypothetical protein